jgi:peptide/nickel transport system substrate-binding protein
VRRGTPDAATNYTEWNNEEWFALWDSLANVRDAAAEREITDKLQEVMYNDPPWLFLYFQPDFYGVSNSVDWNPRRDEILDVNTATAQ